MDAIGALIIWLLLSYAVMIYAEKKGRSRIGFFFLSLLLSPLIALVLLAVGPSNPQGMGLRKCPQCAEWVKTEALKCRFCGLDFFAELPISTVVGPLGGDMPTTGNGHEVRSGSSLKWFAIAGALFMKSVEANETSAIGSLRLISTACFTYDSKFAHGYPAKLSFLGPPSRQNNADNFAADLLDAMLASGGKNGYVFEYAPGRLVRGRIKSYSVIARPSSGSEGRRFFVDETGVIRQSLGGDPDKNSIPLH